MTDETPTPRRYPLPDHAVHDMLRVMTDAEGLPVVMLAPQVCDGPDEWGRLLGVVVANVVRAHEVIGAGIKDGDQIRRMTQGEILEVVIGSMREYLATEENIGEFKVETITSDAKES